MATLVLIFAGIAAFFHILFFCVESLWFISKKFYKNFGVKTAEDAEKMRVMAYNQGFYNLFLAVGCLIGIAMIVDGYAIAGHTLLLFTCSCMVGAAVVLLSSKPQLLSAALIQGGPPLAAIILHFFAY